VEKTVSITPKQMEKTLCQNIEEGIANDVKVKVEAPR
jgi:hypothetical protein